MVMECKYGGGLFLEFQPLTGCMVCDGVGHPYCRFTTICEGWIVFLLIGALIVFLAALFLGFYSQVGCGCWYGCVHYLVVCCYMLYVHCVLALCVYTTVRRRVCVWFRDIDCCAFAFMCFCQFINLKMAISAETCSLHLCNKHICTTN